MSSNLEKIRALLKAENEKIENIKSGKFVGERQPDPFLAHWNVGSGENLSLRFLPDADPTNEYFWREIWRCTLTFNGVINAGGANTREMVSIKVPCSDYYRAGTCPILHELRGWYATSKETGNTELAALASKYWKKVNYLFQCTISPDSQATVKDDNPPEGNQIRRVLLNKELFAKIKSILLNPGVKELPTDYVHGRDFTITKTKNGGGFWDYGMSQFSMSERELSGEELASIDANGLFNLNDFVPKAPTDEELIIIKEMFEASVNSEPFDNERWGHYMRPAGVPKPNTAQSTPPVVPQASTPSSVQAEHVSNVSTNAQPEDAPVQTVQPAAAAISASDLVAKLKARQS